MIAMSNQFEFSNHKYNFELQSNIFFGFLCMRLMANH